jgi:SIR2-like domain
MHQLLLTGAGFSRNWDGWLADEAFEYLLGCSEITSHIRNVLWKHKGRGGFEGALQELRDQYVASPGAHTGVPLSTLDRLLIGMFASMNSAFGQFESGRHDRLGPQPTPVRNFLCRFDAIFTLNQDTLLEQKYQTSDIREGSAGRLVAFRSPGLAEEFNRGTPYLAPGMFRPLPPPYTVPERCQPYFKLHGSSNWRAENGLSILIMGENKGTQIEGVELLNWYREQFVNHICRPDTHLMVIGYSFRDPHINDIIERGAEKGAKIFVIDPEGVDVLKRAPKRSGDVQGLQHRLQGAIAGASRRGLLSTLATDLVELRKLLRFLPN